MSCGLSVMTELPVFYGKSNFNNCNVFNFIDSVESILLFVIVYYFAQF